MKYLFFFLHYFPTKHNKEAPNIPPKNEIISFLLSFTSYLNIFIIFILYLYFIFYILNFYLNKIINVRKTSS
jgi:hypothetical protein